MATTGEKMLDDLIRGLEPELAEGGADRLRDDPRFRDLPAPLVAERLHDYLGSDHGRRLLSPRYRPDPDRTPLETIVRRFPVREEAARELADKLQLRAAGLKPPAMARLVAETLARREYHDFLTDPPARPASEQRVLDVLSSRFYSEVPTDRREAVAAKLSREFGGILDENLLVEKIADRLSHQASADHYGTRPVPRDDPRLRAVSVARREESQAQKRGEDGRFVRETVYKGNPF